MEPVVKETVTKGGDLVGKAKSKNKQRASNSIFVIHPYIDGGQWVFDDDRVGLVREPFVCGADAIIDLMVESIPNATKGVTMLFSASQFPGCQHELAWLRAESGGNWYESAEFGCVGWLCPAMFKYFEDAPDRLYVQVKAKAA